MKLIDAAEANLIESKFFCEVAILEDDEAPRWKFGYNGRRVNDPNPDILLLGAFRHPTSGNNLVGGINLHYINQDQLDRLQRALPNIMKPSNLYGRYWAGKRLVPDIFDGFYRTYNSSYVRGVSKDVLYPKYGHFKTAANWLKKKAQALTKSKAQRQKEAIPKFPQDLKSMQDRLNQTQVNLAQQPPADIDPDTPEMVAARKAFQDYQRRQTLQDIEAQNNRQMATASQELQQAQQEPGVQSPERMATQMQAPSDAYQIPPGSAVSDPVPPQNLEPAQPPIIPPASEPQPPTPQDKAENLEAERIKRREELENAEELDPDMDLKNDKGLEETIHYYSPRLKRYITESILLD
tara:strand:+ start:4324 stop:5376 length:1053 start_codon:yes stop_codon:yes gene_type:complete